MKSISKLKDDARKHELREEWDKAVQVYLQVLKIGEQGEGEVELPLYNRVGDLYVRLGRAHDAVRYYEQAADRYAEAGLYNNAIALCNKAMRYQPHHLGLLRKLGVFSALQGFYADARRYFVEYADKQIAQGKVDDALSALMDFARIADDAESRELLGRRLHERGRTTEAVAELRTAHGQRVRSGQTEQAEALRKEIRSIDPTAVLDQEGQRPRPPSSSFGVDLPGSSHFDPDPIGRTDVDRTASGNVELEENSGAGYGLVDIHGFDDIEEARSQGGSEAFKNRGNFDATGSTPDVDGFFEAGEDAADEAFNLPLLPDADAEDSQPRGFGVTGPGVADRAGFGVSGVAGEALERPAADAVDAELTEFDDFDTTAFDLPLLEEREHPPLDLPDNRANTLTDLELEDFGEADPLAAAGQPAEREAPVDDLSAFDEFVDAESQDVSAPGGFAGWPEDPDADLSATLAPDELATSFGDPLPGARADDALLDIDLEDFITWDEDASAAVEELALEAAAATESAIREAEEVERREAEAGEAAAREAAREAEARAAAREAAAREAAREAEARAAAAREAEAREAAVRQTEARAVAAREGEAREATGRVTEARANAAREAEARAAQEREAEARAAAVREAAARDPWAPEPRTAARPAGEQPRAAAPTSPPPSAPPPAPARRDDSYVDLGSLFAEDETETTRFRIQEALPTGDEDQDFAELLSRFKEKVAEHLPPEDAAAHYDLGLAFKEMGLIDEAIAEFQVALRTGHMRLKVYEELGYCFLHKQQYNIAEKVLRQALQLEHRHELDLLGIYYQLGRAYEAMGRLEQARDAYERVLGMDLHFQDTSERLARL